MKTNHTRRLASWIKYIRRDYQIFLILLPSLVLVFVFCYIPMYGVLIAFKDFYFKAGILGSPWVGFQHFRRFLVMKQFWGIMRNTLVLSLYSIAAGFPAPILLAIILNECVYKKFKKTVQMISYAPHFISTVVICGMIMLFLNKSHGIVNNAMAALGMERINFLIEAKWFSTIYVFSGIWQDVGFSSIIYLAALSGVDPELVEASVIDGANRLQKIWHIDLPAIFPTIIILLIFSLGSLLSVGFEKVLLLQNSLTMDTSDVIATYVYRVGLLQGQYSYTTAIGLFNSVFNIFFLVIFNSLAKVITKTSLW